MMGSTETTFYVLTVYYGAIQVKKIRHTLAACLLTDVVAVTASIILGYVLFGGR
jgi:spore maturation protein SpmB